VTAEAPQADHDAGQPDVAERDGVGREPPPFVLLYALWGGLSWWALHLWTSTSLVTPACDHDLTWLLNVVTIVTLIGAVTALLAAVWMGRAISRVAAVNGRTAMLSALAILINVASVALIVLEGAPVLVIDPCKVA
jgi:hypothetical protein